MTNQHRLPFQDPESVTRRPALNVVDAHVESVADFNESYFAGYNVFRALTYTSSIPMVANLLRQHDFDDFECIFEHNGILSREAEEILAFQAVVHDKLETGLLGLKRVSAERRELIYNRIAEGKVRFFVVKDAIAHAKIYLLEKHDAQRVITGSANLSERAFSGRQPETLVVFDNDQSAWDHYAAQYGAGRDTSTSDLPVDREPLPVDQVRIERTPASPTRISRVRPSTSRRPPSSSPTLTSSSPTTRASTAPSSSESSRPTAPNMTAHDLTAPRRHRRTPGRISVIPSRQQSAFLYFHHQHK